MKKIRWIPMLLSALLLLHPVAYADSAKNFGNDFEGYAENEEIASEMAGTRSWTAVADPDHPGNRVGMIKYVGKNTAALNPQTIASKLGAVTDELEIGLKLKFAANCTNNQSIQFRLKAYTGSKGADVVPWRIHIRGLEEAYNQKILPNSAFAADTWYDVRILVHLKTERYEAFRIKMDDLNAEWEQMTPDGGQELRESSKYDYDSRGVENLRFEAAGNKPDNEGSEERYVWCDDFFCGQYNAASAAEKVLPADGTQNVNVDEVKPSLTFADEMRASTLTPENIILRKESGEAVSYTGSYEKGARIFQDGQYSFRKIKFEMGDNAASATSSQQLKYRLKVNANNANSVEVVDIYPSKISSFSAQNDSELRLAGIGGFTPGVWYTIKVGIDTTNKVYHLYYQREGASGWITATPADGMGLRIMKSSKEVDYSTIKSVNSYLYIKNVQDSGIAIDYFKAYQVASIGPDMSETADGTPVTAKKGFSEDFENYAENDIYMVRDDMVWKSGKLSGADTELASSKIAVDPKNSANKVQKITYPTNFTAGTPTAIGYFDFDSIKGEMVYRNKFMFSANADYKSGSLQYHIGYRLPMVLDISVWLLCQIKIYQQKTINLFILTTSVLHQCPQTLLALLRLTALQQQLIS